MLLQKYKARQKSIHIVLPLNFILYAKKYRVQVIRKPIDIMPDDWEYDEWYE